MKALPLLTLALCIAFLGIQQLSLSSKAKNVTTLKSRIADVKSGGSGAGRDGSLAAASSAKSSRNDPRGTANATRESLADLDLKQFAEAMTRSEINGAPDLKTMMRMQSLLLEATPEELQDLIARTAALDVPEAVKQRMIGEFVRALSEHDPKAALELAFRSDHLDLDRQQWTFRQSFSKWAKDDPASAIAWFDQELAKGTFETKSLDGEARARIEFQRTAIAALLDSDPALARQRLLSLPLEERVTILRDGSQFRVNDKNALAHAELVRETLPEEQRPGALAAASLDLLNHMDYEGLVEHTSRINANLVERNSIVEAAVGRQFERFGWERKPPTPATISEAHSFLKSQVPDDASRITGLSLAKFARSNDNFAQASSLLSEFHQTVPEDNLLIGFIQQAPRGPGNLSSLQDLAGQISDPARRQEILTNLK